MISGAIDYLILMKRRPNGPREVADIQRVVCWRDGRYHLEAVSAEHFPALIAACCITKRGDEDIRPRLSSGPFCTRRSWPFGACRLGIESDPFRAR
jgi:hypothetical protein